MTFTKIGILILGDSVGTNFADGMNIRTHRAFIFNRNFNRVGANEFIYRI